VAELRFSVSLLQGGAVTTAIDATAGFVAGRTPVVVLAHGAGNDMASPFLEFFATALAERGVAVVRFNFPYKEAMSQRPPDPMRVLIECYREVVVASARRTGSPPGALFVGGKSMGGRVASVLVAEGLVKPSGLIFLGYPLHKPGRKDELRSEHLAEIRRPMLFVQGDRDPFCDLELLATERRRLQLAGGLHVVAGGHHSFDLPKSHGAAERRATLNGCADAVVAFVRKVLS
jgi:predicted alpha/beta-hydrolase family hydrolase